MNRRTFLKNLSVFFAIASCRGIPLFNSIPAVYGRNRTAPLIYSNYAESIGEAFEGEKLIYNIGFWLFEKAAIGRMSLKKNENGGYTAVLEAETLGVIGWVTRYRKDTYITHMNETPDGRRFITSVFDKTITIGTKTKRTVTNLDYKKGLMKWKRWTGDKQEEDREEEIPPDTIYDDPLAAFYNFRFGTYGQIEEGREYHIPTFPKKGIKTMYVRIAKAEEKNKRIHSDPDDVDYLADIIIDKELFGSQTGKIEAFFTKEMIPMGGIVKDLIFFGDVRGTLIEMSSRVALKRDLPL